jgi:hypothetical protein
MSAPRWLCSLKESTHLKNFKEYYEFYLTLHQNLWCRRLHVAGQLTTLFYLIMCFTYLPIYCIILFPFIVYPFAWTGHFVFEKNKPAAFTNPVYAKMADWVMLKDWFLGRIKR